MDDHQGAAHEHRGGCLEGRSWALNARRHQNHPKNKLYHFPRFLAARPSVTCNRPKKANIWIIKVLAFRIPLVSLAESIIICSCQYRTTKHGASCQELPYSIQYTSVSLPFSSTGGKKTPAWRRKIGNKMSLAKTIRFTRCCLLPDSKWLVQWFQCCFGCLWRKMFVQFICVQWMLNKHGLQVRGFYNDISARMVPLKKQLRHPLEKICEGGVVNTIICLLTVAGQKNNYKYVRYQSNIT